MVSKPTAIQDLISTGLAEIAAMDIYDPSTNHSNWFAAGMLVSYIVIDKDCYQHIG